MKQLKTSKDGGRRRVHAHVVFWFGALLALAAILLISTTVLLDMEHDRIRPIPVERGRLSQVIAEIEGAMPERGSEGYVRPSHKQATEFAKLASAMEAENLASASRLANALDYMLVWYDDAPTGRRLLMAREEEMPSREVERGWGTIIVDPEGTDVIVEVPHPLFDVDTPEIGVELFEATGAKTLLLAGAHRYSWDDARADVAHAPGTAFDAAHRALLPARYVVQLHGFHAREGDGYPDVVLSAGVAPPPAGVSTIYRSMNGAGIDVGLFHGGARYEDLAGTTNLQGISTRRSGGEFVHVEFAWHVRTDPAERSKSVATLARALAPSAKDEPHLSY